MRICDSIKCEFVIVSIVIVWGAHTSVFQSGMDTWTTHDYVLQVVGFFGGGIEPTCGDKFKRWQTLKPNRRQRNLAGLGILRSHASSYNRLLNSKWRISIRVWSGRDKTGTGSGVLTLSPIQSSCLALCLCFSLSASVRALSLARVLHSRLPIALVVGMVVDAQVQFLQRPFFFVFFENVFSMCFRVCCCCSFFGRGRRECVCVLGVWRVARVNWYKNN